MGEGIHLPKIRKNVESYSATNKIPPPLADLAKEKGAMKDAKQIVGRNSTYHYESFCGCLGMRR
jgi:hypothetical protein